MDEKYEEKLPFGDGTLSVTKTGFCVYFYFPGPRWNSKGTLITIYDFDSYIAAYRKNWKTFLELQRSNKNAGKEITLQGEHGMTIRVGGMFHGICLDYCNLPIWTESQLNNMISSLEGAKIRGPQLMQQLKQGNIMTGHITPYKPLKAEKIPLPLLVLALTVFMCCFIVTIFSTGNVGTSIFYSIAITFATLVIFFMISPLFGLFGK